MTKEAIQRKRDYYLNKGKVAMSDASDYFDYLKANCGEWNEAHANYWKRLLDRAEDNLKAAQVLTELLNDEY